MSECSENVQKGVKTSSDVGALSFVGCVGMAGRSALKRSASGVVGDAANDDEADNLAPRNKMFRTCLNDVNNWSSRTGSRRMVGVRGLSRGAQWTRRAYWATQHELQRDDYSRDARELRTMTLILFR
jgi:hypothetical protein